MKSYLLGQLNWLFAEFACKLYMKKSKFYWFVHEAHLLCYWWEKSNDLRWTLEDQKQKKLSGKKETHHADEDTADDPTVSS